MGCAGSRCQQEASLQPQAPAEEGSSVTNFVSLKDDSVCPGAQPLHQLPLPPSASGAAPPAVSASAGPAECAPERQLPASEEERLAVVAALRRPQPTERFGAVTGLLGTYFEVPVAFVSLIDGHEVVSLPCDSAPFSAPRGEAVCEWPLRMPQQELMVVQDLASDPRFQRAPCVAGEPFLCFYAAAALRCSCGTLGTLCIADHRPRTLSPDKLDFLLRCAALAVQSVEQGAGAVQLGRQQALQPGQRWDRHQGRAAAASPPRQLGTLQQRREHQRREREQQQPERQQRQRPSQQELLDCIHGSADPILACDLSQQPWAVLACNAAAAALADLPQTLPGGLSFWSVFELAPGTPCNSNHQAAAALGKPFTIICRLRPAAQRPHGCSASQSSGCGAQCQAQAGAVAAATAARPASGPDVMAGRLSASDPDAHTMRRPASGGQPGSQLAPLCEQQQSAATAGDGAQTADDLEPVVGRGSLDSALSTIKRKQAPDQLYAVSFAPCTPIGLAGSLGAGTLAAGPEPAGQPAAWYATLRASNLAAMAAQARLGLLVGRHWQLAQQQPAAAVGAATALHANRASAGSSSDGGRGRSVAAAAPRVLLPDNMQGVELGPLLGIGAHGRTYAGRWQGSRVAVKCVELRGREPEAQPDYGQREGGGGGGTDPGSMALVEAVLSKTLRHPHIVPTHAYGVRETGRHMGSTYSEVWIIQDLCTLGSLLRGIERGLFTREDGKPHVLHALLTAAEIAAALAYLHSKGVVHGDVGGNNVLLSPSSKDERRFVAMVSDFGLARPLEVLTQMSTDTYGTISYMPPELVLHHKLSPAVDMYSLGVLLWELMSSGRAWAGMSSLQILAAVTTGRRLEVPDGWPRPVQNLIVRCLDGDPRERPSANQVLEELEGMLAPHIQS